MLILSRKINERIHIGENIVVVITAIGPHRVKVGIEAPPEIPIIREEIIPPEPNTQDGHRMETQTAEV